MGIIAGPGNPRQGENGNGRLRKKMSSAGSILAVVLGAGIGAFAWTLLLTWPGIRRLRRAADAHWSERARLVFPYRGAAGVAVTYVPAVMALGLLVVASPGPWLVAGVAVAASVGAVLGTFPITLATLAGFSWRDWPAALCLWRYPMLLFWVMALAMPARMGWEAWAGVAGLLAWVVAVNRWPVKLGGAGSRPVPAPAELLARVRNLARQVGVPLRGLFLMRKGPVNAFTFPVSQEIAVAEELIHVLTPRELDTILIHELAHLRESPWVTLPRVAAGNSHLVLLFLKPATAAFGYAGLGALMLAWVLLPRAFDRWSRSLESRADARAAGLDPATYASALLKLHQQALMPAVLEQPGSHPHLYDRLLACGITPDFPRPQPAAALTLGGPLVSGAFGLLLVLALRDWLARGTS